MNNVSFAGSAALADSRNAIATVSGGQIGTRVTEA